MYFIISGKSKFPSTIYSTGNVFIRLNTKLQRIGSASIEYYNGRYNLVFVSANLLKYLYIQPN